MKKHGVSFRNGVIMRAAAVLAAFLAVHAAAHAQGQVIGINVLLNGPVSDNVLEDLEMYGQVLDVIPEINALTIRAEASELAAIQGLPFVAGANPDAERFTAQAQNDGLLVPDFSDGANLWNLDAINVTDFNAGRTVAYDGEGVYVAVIDYGLLSNWREYFPEERIDTVHARAFSGGGGNQGTVSEQPGAWEHNTGGGGTKITSVILGFNYSGPEQLPVFLNGVAPKVNIIPVKVFSNSGLTWSSVVTRGLLYVADLKISGALGDAPLVINLSFGGHDHDVAEQAAIDYAIANGVVVVGGAEDRGDAGMRFPGAYPPVISVGNAGWVGQLPPDDPTFIEWILRDVPEDDPSQYFIDLNSGRELAGQDLDVVAPGTWVPVAGTQNGLVNYTFRTTTRLACPHVTGVVALMLQKNPGLTQSDIEGILESTALPIAAGCADISEVGVSPGNQPTWGDHDNVFFLEVPVTVCWDANATGYGLVQADVALAATPLP